MLVVMGSDVHIVVDEQTAATLQERANELGVTVRQLVAELASMDGELREADVEELAELDRRATRATAEGSRVPHDRVVNWLRTWGTDRFRPWGR